MQLHEPIDVGCEPINTILHYGESLVHLLTEITKFNVDEPKLPIYLAESCIYLAESCIYLAESCVYLAESCIRLPEATPNKFFERGELLIDGSRFLCQCLFYHLSSLAAASWIESQVEIWANCLIADEIDIPKFFPVASRLLNHLIRPRSDFGFSILDFRLSEEKSSHRIRDLLFMLFPSNRKAAPPLPGRSR